MTYECDNDNHDIGCQCPGLPVAARVHLPDGDPRRSDETRWFTSMGPVTQWRGLVQNSVFTAKPDQARDFAAALLAAANAADAYREQHDRL